MKIAILSDIHEGLNQKKTETDILSLLRDSLLQHAPDVFILCGDMATGPEKSLNLLTKLQNELPQVQVLYVHGNHDIYHEDSTIAYDKLLAFPGNLGRGPVELNEEWVVIGDGGWYDYSLGVSGFTEEEFEIGRCSNFTWPDKLHAHWPEKDKAVTEKYVAKLEQWLIEHQDKNIILVNHFVPFAHFIQIKDEPIWDFFNAMMGSSKFGELAEKYNVKKMIFGHTHSRYHEEYKGIECICNPLGHYPNEWVLDSPKEEIHTAMKIIEI
ncbi:MAG: metallophosphoesterase [Planococcus donghaensis]